MNTTEAKFILQACRPDGQDAADPLFADAMAQARHDPALAGWLAREQAFDGEVAAKLRTVQAPDGLRAAILAGARMSRPRPWWRRAQVLAMAASVALIFALVALWPSDGVAGGGELAMGAMDDMGSPDHHAIVLGGRGQLHTLLADASMPLSAGMPMGFGELRADGCRSIRIGGHEVLEMCFKRGANAFHLYVARVGDFSEKDSAGAAAPMFMERGQLASVSWRDRRYAYVLATDSGTESLRKVF